MIRKLMASSALVALMSAGAVSVAHGRRHRDEAGRRREHGDDDQRPQRRLTKRSSFPISRRWRPPSSAAPSMRATTPNSDNIGDVNDLIIGDDGSITDAVVGVGGFLGIGEKNVAVPFDELKVVESDGEIRLIYAATREQLEAAPAVDLTAYDPAARYAEEQAAMNARSSADGDERAARSGAGAGDNGRRPPHDADPPPAELTRPTSDGAATDGEPASSRRYRPDPRHAR